MLYGRLLIWGLIWYLYIFSGGTGNQGCIFWLSYYCLFGISLWSSVDHSSSSCGGETEHSSPDSSYYIMTHTREHHRNLAEEFKLQFAQSLWWLILTIQRVVVDSICYIGWWILEFFSLLFCLLTEVVLTPLSDCFWKIFFSLAMWKRKLSLSFSLLSPCVLLTSFLPTEVPTSLFLLGLILLLDICKSQVNVSLTLCPGKLFVFNMGCQLKLFCQVEGEWWALSPKLEEEKC